MGGRWKEEKKIYNEGSDVVMSSSISHAAQEFRRVQKQKVELNKERADTGSESVRKSLRSCNRVSCGCSMRIKHK